MNFGQRSRDLVLECKHADLTKYNDEGVRACLEEITWHVDELTHLVESVAEEEKPRLEVRPSLLLHDAAIRRNKRCLLAYMNHRVNVLKANSAGSENVKKSFLSEAEIDFLQSYNQVRAQYSDSTGLELFQNRMPPTQTLIQVRCLRTLGKVVLADTGATVNLTNGSLHYLPAQDVEQFIQQGYLQQLEGEESV